MTTTGNDSHVRQGGLHNLGLQMIIDPSILDDLEESNIDDDAGCLSSPAITENDCHPASDQSVGLLVEADQLTCSSTGGTAAPTAAIAPNASAASSGATVCDCDRATSIQQPDLQWRHSTENSVGSHLAPDVEEDAVALEVDSSQSPAEHAQAAPPDNDHTITDDKTLGYADNEDYRACEESGLSGGGGGAAPLIRYDELEAPPAALLHSLDTIVGQQQSQGAQQPARDSYQSFTETEDGEESQSFYSMDPSATNSSTDVSYATPAANCSSSASSSQQCHPGGLSLGLGHSLAPPVSHSSLDGLAADLVNEIFYFTATENGDTSSAQASDLSSFNSSLSSMNTPLSNLSLEDADGNSSSATEDGGARKRAHGGGGGHRRQQQQHRLGEAGLSLSSSSSSASTEETSGPATPTGRADSLSPHSTAAAAVSSLFPLVAGRLVSVDPGVLSSSTSPSSLETVSPPAHSHSMDSTEIFLRSRELATGRHRSKTGPGASVAAAALLDDGEGGYVLLRNQRLCNPGLHHSDMAVCLQRSAVATGPSACGNTHGARTPTEHNAATECQSDRDAPTVAAVTDDHTSASLDHREVVSSPDLCLISRLMAAESACKTRKSEPGLPNGGVPVSGNPHGNTDNQYDGHNMVSSGAPASWQRSQSLKDIITPPVSAKPSEENQDTSQIQYVRANPYSNKERVDCSHLPVLKLVGGVGGTLVVGGGDNREQSPSDSCLAALDAEFYHSYQHEFDRSVNGATVGADGAAPPPPSYSSGHRPALDGIQTSAPQFPPPPPAMFSTGRLPSYQPVQPPPTKAPPYSSRSPVGSINSCHSSGSASDHDLFSRLSAEQSQLYTVYVGASKQEHQDNDGSSAGSLHSDGGDHSSRPDSRPRLHVLDECSSSTTAGEAVGSPLSPVAVRVDRGGGGAGINLHNRPRVDVSPSRQAQSNDSAAATAARLISANYPDALQRSGSHASSATAVDSAQRRSLTGGAGSPDPAGAPPQPSPVASIKSSSSSSVSTTFQDLNLQSETILRYAVVVAIDFGTAYSGYAFSFTKDPYNIQIMRKWEGGDAGIVNMKVPTVLLLTPEEQFHSFGFTARDFYHDLDPRQARSWLFFDKFKMALHYNPDLSMNSTLAATNGKQIAAIKVFTLAIRYFFEHALQELADQMGRTVDRKEATMIDSREPSQLLIALEPEAASIYIRKLRVHQLVPEQPPPPRPLTVRLGLEPAPPPNMAPALADISYGTRYMVVDCGGGTVDITVHELGADGSLKELYKASGGPHGSIGVDLEFENLLCSVFGEDFVESYRLKRPAGYVDLMVAFESRKRCASPAKATPLNVSLPFSFIDYFKKTRGYHIDYAMKKYNKECESALGGGGGGGGIPDITYSSQGMLRLAPRAIIALFEPVIDEIVRAIRLVVDHPNCAAIQFLFLVGGFAESPILQHQIRQAFGDQLRIVIPQDMSLTILKGAVIFGLDPSVVMIRRSHLTYGVGILNRFIDDKHPVGKRIVKDGIAWCTDVFDKFVSVDQAVTLGDSVVRSYTPAKPGQKVSVISVYCTDREEANFITDPGVRKCGTLCLDLRGIPDAVLPRRREIRTSMEFGDTEIRVSALDVTTGRCVLATIDFLNK